MLSAGCHETSLGYWGSSEFSRICDRKRFYQDIVATKSNAVLISGDIAEAPTVSEILEEMDQHIVLTN